MTTHDDRSHALYSASSSDRWMRCHGSIQRSAVMPEGLVSGYAEDGTEAHELLEYALRNKYTSAYEAKIVSGLEWEHRHDTEEVRLQSVQDAIDHVQDLLDAYASDGLIVYLETQFRFPTHDNDDCGGTSDVTLYVPELDICVIADFKHGSGVAVTATENSQMMMYAVGSREELRRQGLCNSGKTLYRLMIMQPRAFHKEGQMREWTCNDDRLDAFIGEVNFAIMQTKRQMPEIKPGKYCRWCPAVSACPEAEDHRMRAILPTYNGPASIDQLPKTADLSVERIAAILGMKDQVIEWLTAVEEQAVKLAKEGAAIPGHKLVLAQARSKWQANTEEEARLAAGHLGSLSGLPFNAFIRPKLITITEAKDKLRQAIYQRVGKDKAKKEVEEANKALAQLTIKDTSGNVVLVSRDDKRPELNLAQLLTYKAP